MTHTAEQHAQTTNNVKQIKVTEIKREQRESQVNIAGIRLAGDNLIVDRSDKREILRPYRGQRLGFEGVLIDIVKPNPRNKYAYSLVFASLYAPEEKIELDHVVISITKAEFNTIHLELYTRYYFTAEVTKYFKTVHILGTPVKQENFMLDRLNIYKMVERTTSDLNQPTIYTMNRIQNVLLSKVIEPEHNEEELLQIINDIPNDGKVEQFIEEYNKRYQNVALNKLDMIDALYTNH